MLLGNHGLINFTAPRIVETVKTNIPPGNNSGVVNFSRAPKLGELILIFAGTNTSVNTTTPAGFTLIQGLGSTNKNYSFYKIATASESNPYSVSFSSTVDTKTLIGVIVANAHPTVPIGTSHSLVSGSVNTPQTLVTTPFAQNRMTLSFVHLKLTGNFRQSSSVDNGFTILQQVTDSTSMQSLLAVKGLPADDSGLTTTWSWAGGTTGFVANWIEIKGRPTN